MNEVISLELSISDAVKVLEEEIVLGLIHPKERLVEDELMERFSLKRHAVRQLLTELENIGLIERRKNIGAIVKSYSPEDVINIYKVREILECSCAKLIQFPVQEDKIKLLKEIQQRHDLAIEKNNIRSVFRENLLFHETLFSLSNNSVLVEAIKFHAQKAHVIRSSNFFDKDQLHKSQAEHWEMIKALSAQDSEHLAELCRAHLLPSRDRYLEKNMLIP